MRGLPRARRDNKQQAELDKAAEDGQARAPREAPPQVVPVDVAAGVVSLRPGSSRAGHHSTTVLRTGHRPGDAALPGGGFRCVRTGRVDHRDSAAHLDEPAA